MFVLIAGGGRTGTQLALMLLEQEHQVEVLEHRPHVVVGEHPLVVGQLGLHRYGPQGPGPGEEPQIRQKSPGGGRGLRGL